MICPNCSSLHQLNIFRILLPTIVKCHECGLVYSRKEFNILLYNYYQERVDYPEEKLYPTLNDKTYSAILRKVKHCGSGKLSLLDVGCGMGGFIRRACYEGWQAVGIEVSSDAVNICQKHNIPVIKEDMLLMPANPVFDVITLFDVLEHMPHPKKYLQKAYEMLHPNGCVLITTPNFDTLARYILKDKWRMIHDEHLTYFTYKTLRNMLHSCGFKIRYCRIKTINLTELLSIFTKANMNEMRNGAQKLRKAIDDSTILKFMKVSVNCLLHITGLGEEIFMIVEKRKEREKKYETY